MSEPHGILRIWVYLSETPLLWLTATLVAFVIGDAISARLGRHPLANPVVIAAGLLIALLTATGTAYGDYFAGAQFVHFLLGPATVALAVPLWHNRTAVRRNLVPMCVALVAGSLTAIVSAVTIAWAFGAPAPVLASLAPKSTTAPIAMALTESIGGIPALAAVLVVLTGILGSVIVTPLMNALKITDYAARGFAVGVASHGIGTARAFQVSEEAGTFAGIAMGLNGALTALVFLLAPLFF
ncbi:MAG TPA: LrgB family protein [Amaricoccus sp.]|uniref:LrgB family protein n=1 Tax=Amaricoccus sp. TaxID=1872485 RepID=UPI002CEEFA9D|nr:LrgB family protein [Amaricoccus sp.]HMQ91948.1 LrgB family protein [Amaricoccus sp.]HMR53037.1 LrgB family protein [Amaricoccus sp.]HMR59162.1 LrgB family protein [Amaricoccus sp.]HMT99909.1 LrgB family protein [Amaricoccus sp.]